jgi:hypothetical protein
VSSFHRWLAVPLALVGCAEPAADDRSGTIASVLARADEPLIRARPALAAGRYARMASSPYDFYRRPGRSWQRSRDGVLLIMGSL